jgi:hypothetical protein
MHSVTRPRQRTAERCCPIVELRRYVLHEGKRDVLIDLFDREFVETQEDQGMLIIGQFRDLDDPNAFVWMRGFPTMFGRLRSLRAFYGGPVWKAHAAAANATMITSDDVRLLRPAGRASVFDLGSAVRPPTGAIDRPDRLILVSILAFDRPVGSEILAQFRATITPAIVRSGGTVLGSFVTNASQNTFPALPVREGEHLLVWFSRFVESVVMSLTDALAWQSRVLGRTDRLAEAPLLWRLWPTSRSLLR